MKNILFIHQSAELYGSDKTLLMLVVGLKQKGHHPIVVLPENGPLLKTLEDDHIQVIVTPVVKISRKMFGLRNLITLPFQISASVKEIDRHIGNIKLDCVYSNTLAVLIGLIYARRRKLKHIWHVHEIIEKPAFIKKTFIKLLSLKINTRIIYNSFATKNFWESNGTLLRKDATVVWNGLTKEKRDIAEPTQILELRQKLFGCETGDLIIALVGRINRWKGQLLLLQAIKDELIKNPKLKLVFVGSAPPKQQTYLEKLRMAIHNSGIESQVKIIPFQDNVWPIWQSIDIAVVPSTEPEPFGLVAIEAMLSHKPVIAARHGGLTEIIINNETGLLFEPNDLEDLRSSLLQLILNNNKRQLMGEKGFVRASTFFTCDRYVNDVEKTLVTL